MKKLITLFSASILLFSCGKNAEKTTPENQLTSEEKKDSTEIKHIFNTALTEGKSYEWLRQLTKDIGPRLSGSEGAAKSVVWGEKIMKEVGLDSVWLQPVMVPHWVRGEKEVANYTVNGKKYDVPACALGFSIATPTSGVSGEVIEVKNLKEAEALGEKLRGKIVFFNGAFDNTLINTFSAYGGCVLQRVRGAIVGGKYGAKGVIVRSMTNAIDDYPHTGTMTYGDLPKEQYIPAIAISSKASEDISAELKKGNNVNFYFKQSCKTLPDAPSFNVVGQINGSKHPDKYIVVGGHLDSWDLGEGAHDDGTGIVQSLEVAYLFKKNGIKPKNSVRIVFYMNEENGMRGATEYARLAKANKEIHVGGLESDSGGHTPRGFTIDANEENTKLVQSWKKHFATYGLHDLIEGGSGADVGKLKDDHVTLAGYKPDSQRYFDYHHTARDVFENVHKRELELGSASMASLIYLMDKYLYVDEKVKL